MSVSFNDANFQRALRVYIARTSKTLPEALNTKMFYIARGAARNTPKASIDDIDRGLKVVSYKEQQYKPGKRKKLIKAGKKLKFLSGSPLIFKIINARRGKAGLKGLFGSQMRDAATKLIGKRHRSIGTLKAGWLHAIRKFGRAIGQREDRERINRGVRGKSVGVLAKDGWNPKASLSYNTNSFDKAHRPYIDERLKMALRKAFSDETASMKKYIIDQMRRKVLTNRP